LQQRALARAVAADDPEELARLHGERQVAHRVQVVVRACLQGMQDALLERAEAAMGQPEDLVEAFDLDGRKGAAVTACGGGSRRVEGRTHGSSQPSGTNMNAARGVG